LIEIKPVKVILNMRQKYLDRVVVSTAQMQEIESLVFAAGMPVAALMEKVGGLICQRIVALFPSIATGRIGILVGSGHNGGDALVVARELFCCGYDVAVYPVTSERKELTNCHYEYVASLGIKIVDRVADLANCDLLIDGIFGFGLHRAIVGDLAVIIDTVNNLHIPIVSIDLPSGINTDTGEVLGIAITATHTLCLGLWKLAFVHERAIPYLGTVDLIDIGLPIPTIERVIGTELTIERFTRDRAIAYLPSVRHPLVHKYQQGHLLLIVGSARYAGAAILAGLAARATGVGMLSIAVPKSLKYSIIERLPEALVIDCPETRSGSIKSLPDLDLNKYQAIACGCGLTTKPVKVIESILGAPCPIIFDADGLNIIAKINAIEAIASRVHPTIMTPHLGEFQRLFPDLDGRDRSISVRAACDRSQAILLFKGARTIVADPRSRLRVIPASTPALARGGSGDVLTGLIGGLVATNNNLTPLADIVATAAWWHAQAGINAAIDRGEWGVDPLTLIEYVTSLTWSTKSGK
jgi:ADP-dependent NAD(P)H-hydrate dehydratase / NAD(P)H-hydrate epimerase